MNLQAILIAAAALVAVVVGVFIWNGTSSDATPSPDALLERWAKAVGGDRLNEVEAVYFSNTIRTSGLEGVVEEWYTSEGQHHQKLNLADVYKITTVYDHTASQGWILDHNNKVQTLQGVDLEDELTNAYLGSFSHLQSQGISGQAEFLGEDETGTYWKLLIQPRNGKPVTFYLDKTSGLPFKEERHSQDDQLTSFFSDWREVGGIKFPFSFHQTNGEAEFDFFMDIQEVQINPTLATDAFDPLQEPGPDFQFENGRDSLGIPIELNNNHIYLKTKVNGSEPIWFVLDTGADFTVIDTNRANELELELQGSLQGGGAGEGSVEVALINDVSFEVAGVQVTGQTVASIDFATLSALEGRAINGILGYDFISRFIIEIDYEQQQMNLYDPAQYVYNGSGEKIPFTIEGNDPFIETNFTIAGQTYSGKFMVDSGARSALALGKPYIEMHQLLDQVSPLLDGPLGFGVGGATKQLLGRVSSLQLGQFNLPDVLTAFSQDEGGALANPDRAGIIGGEMLRHFTVVFDYTNQLMILDPNADFNDPSHYNMSGLTLMSEGENFEEIKIINVLENSPAQAAGIEAGDQIVSVNGIPANDWSLEALSQLMRQPDTIVTLQLNREGELFEATLLLEPLI